MIAPAWRPPALLAILSTAGLVTGLLADGPWDLLASAALLAPLLAAWTAGRRRRLRGRSPEGVNGAPH